MLELINVSKSFGEKEILKNFSYKFESKGIYVITGKSGIGKTTLLRLIAGLDKSFTGQILRPLGDKVSYAFQEHRLFPNLNAKENAEIALSTKEEKRLCEEILKKLHLNEKDFTLYPNELSGGMAQRVSLARALSYDAPLLLLDEPFKELDDTVKSSLLDIISEEGKARVIIIVTHDKDDITRLNAAKIELV